MSITAKRGDYRITDEVDHRSVASNLRLTASTFSPNADRSRFHITDSGRQYDIRVVQSAVRIRQRGQPWETLAPRDPLAPWGVSFHRRRAGDAITVPVRFDMVAASRGRLLAKEAGTDRFFSLIIDPLFRTSQIALTNGGIVTAAADGGDPIVPSTYLKLDPEFFTRPDGATPPAGLGATYAHHPAAERFRVFALQLEAELSDMWCVLPTAGVWHLVDVRSPLKVFDLDDINCLSDGDVKVALTKSRIKEVLIEAARAQYRDQDLIQAGADFAAWLGDQIAPDVPDAIEGPLDALRGAADSIESTVGDLVTVASSVPIVGGAVRSLRTAVINVRGAVRDLSSAVSGAVRGALNHAAARIVNFGVDLAADILAGRIRDDVNRDGIAALFGPLWLAGGLLVRELSERKVVAPVTPAAATILPQPVDPATTGRQPSLPPIEPVDWRRLRCRGARRGLGVHLGKLRDFLDEQNNRAIGRLIDAVVEQSRSRRRVTVPNAPPPELPTYRHLVYEEQRRTPALGAPPARRYERTAIAFSKVMDLGIGTVHWSEQWHMGFGGEMHAIFARRPMFQQEQFGLGLYRILNGPVIDGDGWQDGTSNFYILVTLDGQGSVSSTRKFAVLFLDEQSYFSQRWRLVHPVDDIAGDLFSIARQLRESPEYFDFNVRAYWDPFEAGHITQHSRMAVARQIIAVTGFDPTTNDAEIYTFCFSWGLSDRTWRWRRFPLAAVTSAPDPVVGSETALPPAGGEQIYQNTMGIREDGTIHVRGWGRVEPGQAPVEGRWFQKYLPSSCQHTPMAHELTGGKPASGFDHPWSFVTEATFQEMDAFYQLGVYEHTVDSRCQYYPVDILSDPNGRLPPDDVLTGRIWENGRFNPLRIETTHFNWELPEDDEAYVPMKDVLRDHGKRDSMSMYERTTRFRLRQRGSLGWIAVFADKRDDDLQSASHLPRTTRLTSNRTPRREVTVLVRSNRRVLRPPVVQAVRVRRMRVGPRTQSVLIEFWTPLGVDEANESLWRIAIGTARDPVLFSSEIHGVFARQALPTAPLPIDPTPAQVQTPEFRYVHEWSGFDDLVAARIDAACTPAARSTFGTSVWFENVVGLMATPDQIDIR